MRCPSITTLQANDGWDNLRKLRPRKKVIVSLVTSQDCEILAITATRVDGILEKYKNVFEGLLPGEYKIIADDSVQSKGHPP